jgi:hypothetical protein
LKEQPLVRWAAVLIAGFLLTAAVWWRLDGRIDRPRSTDIDEGAVAEAQGYEGAPVLWVGPEFDIDLDGVAEPLASFGEFDRKDADEEGLPDEILLGYGQCEFGPDSGCALPLSIRIEFTCSPAGSRLPDDREELLGELRGARLVRLSHLRLITDEVQISVYTDVQHELRVAEELRGANGLAADIGTASDLTNLVDDCRRS